MESGLGWDRFFCIAECMRSVDPEGVEFHAINAPPDPATSKESYIPAPLVGLKKRTSIVRLRTFFNTKTP